jgi:hypothetical protein
MLKVVKSDLAKVGVWSEPIGAGAPSAASTVPVVSTLVLFCLLDLLFDDEDGDSTFLRNVDNLPGYMESH